MSEVKKETMKTYVVQTPEAVEKNIKNSKELVGALVKEYLAKDYKRIVIVACGSSYNGSKCALPFMSKIFKKKVELIPPFTFTHFENDVKDNDFVMVVSQSGRSTNAIEALETLKAKGHRTIGITGDLNSDFSEICDLTCEWGVGIEKVGYVTKGVICLALFFMLFALEAQLAKGKLPEAKYEKYKAELLKTVEAHKELQASTQKYIENHEKQLQSIQEVYLFSAGANMGTVTEGALKISETVLAHASYHECEEFLHGPLYPMTPNYMVIGMETANKKANERIEQIYAGVNEVTDRVCLVKCGKSSNKDVISTNVKLMDEVMPLAYLAVCPLIAEYASNGLTKQQTIFLKKLEEKASTKSKKIPRNYKPEA